MVAHFRAKGSLRHNLLDSDDDEDVQGLDKRFELSIIEEEPDDEFEPAEDEDDDFGLHDLMKLAKQLINDHYMFYKSRDEFLEQKRALLDKMIKRRLRRKQKEGAACDDDDELMQLLMQAR